METTRLLGRLRTVGHGGTIALGGGRRGTDPFLCVAFPAFESKFGWLSVWRGKSTTITRNYLCHNGCVLGHSAPVTASSTVRGAQGEVVIIGERRHDNIDTVIEHRHRCRHARV